MLAGVGVIWLKKDPLWKNFRHEPRFQQARAEAKAEVDEMCSRVEEMEPELESYLSY